MESVFLKELRTKSLRTMPKGFVHIYLTKTTIVHTVTGISF